MVAINGEKMSHQSASLSTEDIIQTQLLYQCPGLAPPSLFAVA